MTTDLRIVTTALVGSLTVAALSAQNPPTGAPSTPTAGQEQGGGRRGGPPPVPPLTPSPSRVLAPGAVIEKLAGDFIFTEGPTTDTAGNVYFVDQDNNRIMKYDTAPSVSPSTASIASRKDCSLGKRPSVSTVKETATGMPTAWAARTIPTASAP